MAMHVHDASVPLHPHLLPWTPLVNTSSTPLHLNDPLPHPQSEPGLRVTGKKMLRRVVGTSSGKFVSKRRRARSYPSELYRGLGPYAWWGVIIVDTDNIQLEFFRWDDVMVSSSCVTPGI